MATQLGKGLVIKGLLAVQDPSAPQHGPPGARAWGWKPRTEHELCKLKRKPRDTILAEYQNSGWQTVGAQWPSAFTGIKKHYAELLLRNY